MYRLLIIGCFLFGLQFNLTAQQSAELIGNAVKVTNTDGSVNIYPHNGCELINFADTMFVIYLSTARKNIFIGSTSGLIISGTTTPAEKIAAFQLYPNKTEGEKFADSLQATGWRVFINNQHTEAAPLSVTAGDTIALPMNDVTIIGRPQSDMIMFDTVSNKMTPISTGDFYNLRINIKAKTDAINSYGFIGIDIGGNQNIIAGRNITFNRGGGVEHSFSVALPIFTLGTFIANGGEIIVIPHDDTDFYDYSFLINRTYANF